MKTVYLICTNIATFWMAKNDLLTYFRFLLLIIGKVPTELLERVKHRNAGNSMQLDITEKLLANLHRRTNFALQVSFHLYLTCLFHREGGDIMNVL